jgi:phage-related minor tail protein
MEDLGATIDSQAAGSIASLGDAWDRMSMTIAGAGRHILAFFAPALEFIMDLITEAFGQINKLIKGVRILGNGFAIWGKRTGEFMGILSSEEANASIKKNGDAIRELWNGTQATSNSAAKLKQNMDAAGRSADSMMGKLKPINLNSKAGKNDNVAKAVAAPAFKSLKDIETKTEETAINMRETFRDSLKGIGEDFNGLGDIVTNVYSKIRQDMTGRAANLITDKITDSVFGVANGLTQELFRPSSKSIGPVDVPSISKFFGGFFADGGEFAGGKPIVVGERGPEMIIPQRGGTVIPNHKLSGSNVSINMNINTPNAGIDCIF